MNWGAAVKMHCAALLCLISSLYAIIGVEPGGSVETVSRWARSKISKNLLPAESAARRLIVIYAFIKGIKDAKVAPRGSRGGPDKPIVRGGGKQRPPLFPLIDPRKTFDSKPRRPKGSGPRLSVIGWIDPVFEEEVELSAGDELNAAGLCRRLEALRLALMDLDKQAKRLRRIEAKRKQAPPGPGCVPPIRPGFPPGWRKRQTHDVDEILAECHRLVQRVLNVPESIDTS